MKSLLDLLPLVVFFAGYYGAKHWTELANDFLNALLGVLGIAGSLPADQVAMACATQLAMFATIFQVAVLLLMRHKVDKVLWITLVVVIAMSIATLVFHDPAIIKWRSTVLAWLFGGILLGGEVLLGRNLVRAMLDSQVSLPDPAWRMVNYSWIAYFAFAGCANLFVAARFSEEAWVNFNMFGDTAIMVLFMLGQMFYISRHMQEAPEKSR